MSTARAAKWWLVINGKADGPHDEAHLAKCLTEGQIDGLTQACLVGQREWHPIEEWQQLAAILPPAGSVPPPIPQPVASNPHEPSVHQSGILLPEMAQWIGIYAIF